MTSSSLPHRAPTPSVRRFLPFSALVLFYVLFLFVARLDLACAGPVDPTIMWSDCTGPADDPTVGNGNYYNLCIQKHSFVNQNFAWTFTLSNIRNTNFSGCTFANTPQKKMNISFTTWTNVLFSNCQFGSFTSDPVSFDNAVLQNVIFSGCTFESTAQLLFSKFEFSNVLFINCVFASDTLFELGQMTQTFFNSSYFAASTSSRTPSPGNAVTFKSVTVRQIYFTACQAVNPLIFSSAAVANMQVNKTNIGDLWCHEIPKSGKTPQLFSAFNDTAFDRVQFGGTVSCDRTTWKGMQITRSSFLSDVDFSMSNILNLYWDTVDVTPVDGSCRTLDLSNGQITGEVLANTSASCIATFANTRFDQVFVHNFYARQPNFKDALFSNQEYVDSECCTVACGPLECKCNITKYSGLCPTGSSKVNINVSPSCFAGSATVSLISGASIRMDELQYGHRVAVGGGLHSDVFFFGHRNADMFAEFVRIASTSKTGPLLISPGHYLYVNGKLATAASVRVGDNLRGPDNLDALTVTAISREVHRGLFAPASVNGDLLVDGVVVSSYTNVLHPRISHWLLGPLRLMYHSPLRAFGQTASSVMHHQSFDWVARMLRLPEGPVIVTS